MFLKLKKMSIKSKNEAFLPLGDAFSVKIVERLLLDWKGQVLK